MKIKLFAILFSLINLHLISQTTIWYFGDGGGVRFYKSNGAWLTQGQSGSAMVGANYTPEGCAAVMDANNNLLFYGDGKNIYHGFTHLNQNFNLLGTASATHSLIIVPVPNSQCKKFMLFTTEGIENLPISPLTPNGISVSLLTVNGQAPFHTISMTTPIPFISNKIFSEKLAATPDNNGGWWVVGHDFELSSTSSGKGLAFYKFHITSAFASTSITTSTQLLSLLQTNMTSQIVGANHMDAIGNNAQGQMKFSKDGLRLGLVLPTDKKIEIFDFNKTSGGLTLNKSFLTSYPDRPYGFEFSPSGNIIYVTETGTPNFSSVKRLLQYDISNINNPNNLIEIYTLPVLGLTAANSYYYGALQLGPDDKIYCASRIITNKLAVISDPNNFTNCSYSNFSSIGAASILGASFFGLPTVISTLENCYNPSGDLDFFTSSKICVNENIIFNASYIGCFGNTVPVNASWNYGDGTSGTSPNHVYTSPNNYTVTLNIPAFGSCPAQSATKTITVQSCPEFNCGPSVPIVKITYSPLSAELNVTKIKETEYAFKVSASGGLANYHYEWLVNGKRYYTFKFRNKEAFFLKLKAGEALSKVEVRITDKMGNSILKTNENFSTENNTIEINK
jgi:hypothetical protein